MSADINITLMAYVKANAMDKLVYITLISLFFPINIMLMGRDALTTGTLCIMILFAYGFIKKQYELTKLDFVVFLLIVSATISTIYAISNHLLEENGPALRQLVNFASALLLFVAIKNSRQKYLDDEEQRSEYIEKLLGLIVILVASNVVIALAIKYFPAIEPFFKIFYGRESDELAIIGSEEIERLSNFLLNSEQMAEIAASLIPFAIYMISKKEKNSWYFVMFIFMIGILMSVTRSGIVLAVAGVLITLLYFSNKKTGVVIACACVSVAILTGVYLIKPEVFKDIAARFASAKQAYSSSGEIVSTINRDNFPVIWADVNENLTLFGHSLTRIDHHNLLLTTLHQLGIIGTLLFLSVFLYPAVKLLKSVIDKTNSNRDLIFVLTLSLTLFMINEMKFEFTRTASYQQIWWTVLALCCTATENIRKRK